MKALLLALLLAGPVLLAGCATQTSGPSQIPRDEQGRYIVKMTTQLRFVPDNAAIPANSTVVWVLDGKTPHDVTATDESWSSDAELGCKVGGPGCATEFARKFEQAGTVRYWCKVHGTQMSGTLTVG